MSRKLWRSRWSILKVSFISLNIWLAIAGYYSNRPLRVDDFLLLTVVVDEILHGLIAIMVNIPIVYVLYREKRSIHVILFPAIIGIWLDLDHAVAAGSLNINAMLSLGSRPPTHSVLFAIIFSILAMFFSENPLVALAAFTSILSHLIHDVATGGTVPIFYPMLSVDHESILWLRGEWELMIYTFLLWSTTFFTLWFNNNSRRRCMEKTLYILGEVRRSR